MRSETLIVAPAALPDPSSIAAVPSIPGWVPFVIVAVLALFLWWRSRRNRAAEAPTPLAGLDTGLRHTNRLPTRTNRGF